MKHICVLCVLCASSLLASEPIDIGAFDYKGKTYSNAKVSFASADEIKISSRSGDLTIPWNDLNPSVQFRLKPERAKIIAANADRERKTAAIANGLHIVCGSMVSVVDDGCVVAAEGYRPSTDPMARAAAFRGQGRDDAFMASIPYAKGMIFVRGLKGLADGATVLAMKTSETYRYTTAQGDAATIRIFDLAPAP